MKKYAFLALCLVLTTAMLVGCGCTNQKMDEPNMSQPTVLPTNEEVWDNTTTPTSRPTTPSTAATEPSQTIDRGNGPLEDTPSTDNGAAGGNNGGTDGTGSGGSGTAGEGGTGGITGGANGGSNGSGSTTEESTAGSNSRTGRARQYMPRGQ